MSEEEVKSEEVKPDEAKGVATPVALRGVLITTDGELVTLRNQTCSNLELVMFGQAVMKIAQERERAAMAAIRQGQAPPPLKVSKPDEAKPDEPGKG